MSTHKDLFIQLVDDKFAFLLSISCSLSYIPFTFHPLLKERIVELLLIAEDTEGGFHNSWKSMKKKIRASQKGVFISTALHLKAKEENFFAPTLGNFLIGQLEQIYKHVQKELKITPLEEDFPLPKDSINKRTLTRYGAQIIFEKDYDGR